VTRQLPSELRRGRIGLHALPPELTSKLLAPATEVRLPDVEPTPVHAMRTDHEMNMRMILIRVHHERVAVLQSELLPRERAARCKEAVRRRPRRHRQNDVVNELGS